MKKALLVVDPQKDFFENDNPNLAAFQATIPVINDAIAVFRKKQLPIIFIQHVSKTKPVGNENWEISPAFDHYKTDLCINKNHFNAFWNTDLESILKSTQVDSVVVCGYMAEYCILSTLRGALERSFEAFILEDSIASLKDRFTLFTLDISPTITLEELQK